MDIICDRLSCNRAELFLYGYAAGEQPRESWVHAFGLISSNFLMAFLDCQQASIMAIEIGREGLTLCAEPEVVVVLFLLPPPLPDNVNILIRCFRSAAAAALPSSCQRCCSVILTALSHLPLSRNSGNEVHT